MHKILSLLAILLVSACVSTPKFQKSTVNEEGYTIKSLETPNSFQINVQLPSDAVTPRYVNRYAFRAVGEECLALGFSYFDFIKTDETKFNGYCYVALNHKALALSFEDSGLKKNPNQYIIEDLNNKTITKLKKGDEVLEFDKQMLKTMTEVKSFVYTASSNNKKFVNLKIKRNGEVLTVAEPLADFEGGLYSPKDLTDVREVIK